MKKIKFFKSFILMLLFVPLVAISQKRDFGEEQKRSKQNEKMLLKSKMNCTTENANAKLFMDPSVSSDSYDGTV